MDSQIIFCLGHMTFDMVRIAICKSDPAGCQGVMDDLSLELCNRNQWFVFVLVHAENDSCTEG
jgi:hypothetical protein